MAIAEYLSGINQATAGPTAEVNAASQNLASLQSGAGTLTSKLKEALNTKLNNNKDIINQQSETMQNYFNAGPMAREKYSNIWDPFKKASLVEQEKTMALKPYDTLTEVLSNRMGDVSDIVESGVSGWQGLINAATTKLGAAQTNLQTALQAYQEAASQQSEADKLAENTRQFDEQVKLDKWKALYGSSGGGLGDLGDLLGLNLGDEQSNTNNQEPPYTPIRAGIKKEYPPGSGVVWVSNNKGGWD